VASDPRLILVLVALFFLAGCSCERIEPIGPIYCEGR